MTRPPFIKSIQPINFLSFGSDCPSLELKNLNILIGPNGSGKSNLLHTLACLKSVTINISNFLTKMGPLEFLVNQSATEKKFRINCNFNCQPPSKNRLPLSYEVEFTVVDSRFSISYESITSEQAAAGRSEKNIYYKNHNGNSVINSPGEDQPRQLKREFVSETESVFTQKRDAELYPELFFSALEFEKIMIYQDWIFGKNNLLRKSIPADLRNDRLEEDGSNLGMRLNKLFTIQGFKRKFIIELGYILKGLTDVVILVEGSAVQIFFYEGDTTIPATRLSDGTLRYIALLCILLDPLPPPLICIEEPELGLNPMQIHHLSKLLDEASERTQVIITTHSDILVDSYSDMPEAVIVTDRLAGHTTYHRLDSEKVKEWLEEYSLGGLWLRGFLENISQ